MNADRDGVQAVRDTNRAPAANRNDDTAGEYREAFAGLRAALQQQRAERTRKPGAADGRNTSPDEATPELDPDLVEALDRLEEMLRKYAARSDGARLQGSKDSRREPRDVVSELGRLEVRPWPHGPSFYADPANCVGVLMTTVLLTLGAPFWFNMLKYAANLRDMLKPRETGD